MDDDLRLVAQEHFFDRSTVADIATLQRTPADGPIVPFFQRVQADRLRPGLGQRLADMTADVTSAAGDEHRTSDREQ